MRLRIRTLHLTQYSPKQIPVDKFDSVADDCRAEPAETAPPWRPPLGYTIDGAVEASGFSRTRVYDEIAAGRLKAVKACRRTIILANSLAQLIKSLPPAEIGKAAKMAALEARNEK